MPSTRVKKFKAAFTGVALLAVALANSPSSAATQKVAEPAGMATAHLALASQLVEEMKASKLQMSVVPQVVEMIMPLVIRGNEDRSGEVRQILTEEYAIIFAAKRVEMLNITRDAYARHFNDQQLRDLIAFYQTDTGKRLVELQPTITSESMRDGQALGRAAVEDAFPRIMERLRKANLKVPQKI